MAEDDYEPAERPPGMPAGDRIRFEREGDYEQGIFGGSARDIERSILGSTERNAQILGKRIVGVKDLVGDLGSGSLQEIQFNLDGGGSILIKGIALEVEIR